MALKCHISKEDTRSRQVCFPQCLEKISTKWSLVAASRDRTAKDGARGDLISYLNTLIVFSFNNKYVCAFILYKV